jgi:biotin operon repressor
VSADVKPLDYLRAVRDSRDLTGSEKLVAMMQATHAGQDGRDAHPGEKLLAAETGFSEKTVRKHLHSLREKGWLQMLSSGRGGAHDRSSAFSLNIPTGNGYRLEDESQPVSEDAQPVTDDFPTGNGYRTNDLRDALRNAPDQIRPSRKGRRARHGTVSSLAGKSPAAFSSPGGKSPENPQPRKSPDGWWVEDDG